MRVARGAVVARVGGREVKAYQQGYFVAGKDGQESTWRYSSIWPSEQKEFSKPYKLQFLSDNTAAMRGQIVGKIIEQPAGAPLYRLYAHAGRRRRADKA